MEVKRIDVTIVPAQRGYKLIHDDEVEYESDNTIPDYWMSDIIGWRVETGERENGELFSLVEAITIDGCRPHEYSILRPDGVVDEPLGINYLNIATFIGHLRERSNGKDT